ncbi:DUF4189 domain-containing protein [Nocardia sp. NPDC050712]|uniref:DUF4189 domain-containing protein n=1 Tax=Nocardia sp. NPDC050712 TaxID=3155518 RepID=UPI0033EDB030
MAKFGVGVVARVVVTAALAAGVSTVAAGPATAKSDDWGAIAYSPSSGETGWGRNYSTKKRAERAALETCKKSDCKVLLNFVNKCGAAARAKDGSWSLGRGSTNAEANANAVRAATGRNPQIKESICND